MKSCPTCNRTFEDTFTFCLIDGAVLSAPYDPAAPNSTGPAGDTAPPQTEVLNPGTSLDSLPPTQAGPRDMQSTIAAPFVPQPIRQQQPSAPLLPDYLQKQPAYPRRKSSVVRKALIALAVIAVLVIAFFVFLEIMFATHRSTVQNIMPPKANANANHGLHLDEDFANDEAKTREELRTDPDNAELNRHLASDLYFQGKYSEAEAFARKAIRLNPNYSAAHYTLAAVLKEQNKIAESNAEWKKAEALAAKGQ